MARHCRRCCSPYIVYTVSKDRTAILLISQIRPVVFRGGQPSGQKKRRLGIVNKKGTSYGVYQQAIVEVGPAETEPGGLADPDPVDPDPEEPKKQRSDDNWRVARAVCSCDKRLGRILSVKSDLAASNRTLWKEVHVQKESMKQLKNEQYIEA